jgi:hypothetical protein
MAQCRKMVGQGYVAHPCEVEVDGNGKHEGPCMSRDQARSITERNNWQAAQDALGQFQKEGTPNSFMVEGGERVHPDQRRKFVDVLLGITQVHDGRWCVCLGYEGEWTPIVDYSEMPDPLPSLPAYAKLGKEIVCVTDKRESLSPQAQAQMYVVSGTCFTPSPREVPGMPGWTAEGGVIPMPESMRSTLAQWEKADAVNPNAAGSIEEPPPTPSEGDVWLEIIADMEQRRQYGIDKYGQPVQRFNGRSALKDAYAEQLDLVVYMRQRIGEEEIIKTLVAIAYHGLVIHVGDDDTDARAALTQLAEIYGVIV